MSLRILFLGTTCPFGDISGAGLRTLNIARQLAQIGSLTTVFASSRAWTPEQTARTREAFEVALLTTFRPAPIRTPLAYARKLLDPRFLNTNGVEVPPEHAQRVADLVAKHDVVWIHTLKLANAFGRFRWPHTVMDVDDFPSRYHRLAARHAGSLREKWRRTRLAFSSSRHEQLCFDRFDVLTVCKDEDRPAFGDPSRVHIVPNGFATPEPVAPAPVAAAPRFGMIGDFNYLPNHDGLRWFMAEVWAAIQARVPTAELRLVGKASDTIARQFAGRAVSGLGYVPDVGAEMATWSAMIVPTRLGGGTHLKVAEGLARQVPLVTTRHGARGYTITAGEHALLADTPADFATACLRLAREPALGDQLRAAGARLFREQFSWDSIRPAMAGAIEACLARQRTELED